MKALGYEDSLNTDYTSKEASQHQNPIEKHRRPTDRSFIFVFAVIVIAWVIICILGFNVPKNHGENPYADSIMHIQWYFNAPFHRLSVLVILPFIITTVIAWLCAFITEKYTKQIITIGMALFLFTTVASCSQAIFGTIYKLKAVVDSGFNPFDAIIYVAYHWFAAIYMFTCCFCFLKADKKVLCDLTKDYYGAILHSPSIVFFMCFITILTTMITSFTVNALFYMCTTQIRYLTIFYMVAILLGGLYIACFLTMLAIMVVTEFAINYYWDKDKEASSHFSIVNALRNHSGTMIFASTLFISFTCGIIQGIKYKRSRNNKEDKFIHFVTKVFLAIKMPGIALIFTSIYGTGFVKSSKTAFDVVLRHASLFLATLGAWEAIWTIPVILTIIGGIVVLVTAVDVTTMDTDEYYKNISLLVHGIIYPLVTFAFLSRYTMTAMVVNKIIMLNKEDEDNEKKAQIGDYA